MERQHYAPAISVRDIYSIFLKRWEEEILSELKETERNRYKKATILFQFHYVFYLCGYEPGPEKAVSEFKALTAHALFKKDHTVSIFGEIEQFLIDREAYEALSLFTKINDEFSTLVK